MKESTYKDNDKIQDNKCAIIYSWQCALKLGVKDKKWNHNSFKK